MIIDTGLGKLGPFLIAVTLGSPFVLFQSIYSIYRKKREFGRGF
jgi:hypothetical protein